jgi:hypothetical protein
MRTLVGRRPCLNDLVLGKAANRVRLSEDWILPLLTATLRLSPSYVQTHNRIGFAGDIDAKACQSRMSSAGQVGINPWLISPCAIMCVRSEVSCIITVSEAAICWLGYNNPVNVMRN